MPEYINLLDKLTEGRELPKGYDHWAIKTVRADFRTKNNFVWPFPGRVARAQGPFLDHEGSCPAELGDGICIATTWAGLASGGVPASTLLLVAYKSADLLGNSESGKLRVKAAKVIELIDGIRLIIESGTGANLRSANLRYTDLRSADLRYADLRSANLRSADLSYADLRYTDLRYADLRYADLRYADLRYADLSSANLRSADLRSANLRSADLSYANLRYADLSYADLRSANLRYADLSYANLSYADLSYADLSYANLRSANLPSLKPYGIRLPEGFVWPTS
jgi:uncharacterized protein YjbI with pentapeptide repeats